MKWSEFLQRLHSFSTDVRPVWGDVERRVEVYCKLCLDSIYVLPAGVTPPAPWEDEDEEVLDELAAEVLRAVEDHFL